MPGLVDRGRARCSSGSGSGSPGGDGDEGSYGSYGADVVVEGGSTRTESVCRGVAAVPESAEVIVVHDAARPLASAALFEAVISAVTTGGAGGAVPGVAGERHHQSGGRRRGG